MASSAKGATGVVEDQPSGATIPEMDEVTRVVSLQLFIARGLWQHANTNPATSDLVDG